VFDFSKLSDVNYLINAIPSAQFASKKILLIIFGLIIFLAVILWLASYFGLKKSKVVSHFLEAKVYYLLLTTGIVGLALIFFRIVGASYLSMRLIFLIFLLAMLVWAIYLIFYLIVSLPQEYQEESDQKRRAKYLPKRKIIR
jgi:ABC-type transport system involved in multi-copper enzyme maturation permease subunit